MLTPYQIAERAERYDGRANIAAINALFRRQDESHLFPIRGRFNATERAIRRLRRLAREGLVLVPGLEYALALDAEISALVNGDY
jgi:nitroreductase